MARSSEREERRGEERRGEEGEGEETERGRERRRNPGAA